MTAADFAFYMFAVVTLAAGLMVTISRNPVVVSLFQIVSAGTDSNVAIAIPHLRLGFDMLLDTSGVPSDRADSAVWLHAAMVFLRRGILRRLFWTRRSICLNETCFASVPWKSP